MFSELIITLCMIIHAFGMQTGRQEAGFPAGYRDPDAVVRLLEQWERTYPDLIEIIQYGKSAGGRPLVVARIASGTQTAEDLDSRPGVFVSANLEGIHLVGTEAALHLAGSLLSEYGHSDRVTNLLNRRSVYVAPLLNPDGAAACFRMPGFEKRTTDLPVDEDGDGLTDEDGPEDLNGDGLIVSMRVRDPRGEWIVDPEVPRLMRSFSVDSAETIRYRILQEGMDNDRDGRINEDPPGGIDPAANFPFEFEYVKPRAEVYIDSSKENLSLMEFLIERLNISLVLHFAQENSLIEAGPETNRSWDDVVGLPKNIARVLDLDADRSYRIEYLFDRLRDRCLIPESMELSADSVAAFLGLVPYRPTATEDRDLFARIGRSYRSSAARAGLDVEGAGRSSVARGRFTAYVYFHLGVPVFSVNPWMIPDESTYRKPAVDGSEATSGPAGVVHSDLKRLRFSDVHLGGTGFIDWERFEHRQLGELEIGGFVPLVGINPPRRFLDRTFAFHTDFFIGMMSRMSDLQIESVRVYTEGDTMQVIRVTFHNPGAFPTATVEGRIRRTAWPITVRLKTTEDQMIYSGEPFEIIPFIEAEGREVIEWRVKGERGSHVILTAESPRLGKVTRTINLR